MCACISTRKISTATTTTITMWASSSATLECKVAARGWAWKFQVDAEQMEYVESSGGSDDDDMIRTTLELLEKKESEEKTQGERGKKNMKNKLFFFFSYTLCNDVVVVTAREWEQWGSDADGGECDVECGKLLLFFAILSLISLPRSPSLFSMSMYHMNEAAYEFSCNFSS